MASRHSIRVRRVLVHRQNVASTMQPQIMAGLQAGWRRLYAQLRRIEPGKVQKEDWIDGWYEAWQADFSADMESAFQEAIQEVSADEQAFWTQAVAPVNLDPEKLVREFITQRAHLIRGVTGDTKQMVRDQVQAWYGNPDASLTDLAAGLSDEFGESRAWLIANNETTALVSGMTRESMMQLGLLRWKWQSRQEWNTCPPAGSKRELNLPGPDGKGYNGCRELHGLVFTINDKMPPDGSHIGCMCTPAPIVE
jgi:hypothetical protein